MKRLISNFTSLSLLADFLQLSAMQRRSLLERPTFPLSLPRRLALKIEKGTLEDPILRQFIPLREEQNVNPLYTADPLHESVARKCPNLLHKYPGRVLLLTSRACAMHCRYCFRRLFPHAKKSDFSSEMEYIRKDSSICEVILSGGDPLSLSDTALKKLLGSLAEIRHVDRVRIHTRFPVGIPERIDGSFLSLFAGYPKQLFFVLHINHPREIDRDLIQVLDRLRSIPAVLLSQTVLLHGVNDEEETLFSLCQSLD